MSGKGKCFRDIELRPTYSSADANLLQQFYLPVLSCSHQYDRAVGFFSAAMLSYAAKGLSAFVDHGGRMRLIIGEPLSSEEFAAVKKGVTLREVEDRIAEKLAEVLRYPESKIQKERLEILSWLIASDRLELRFALTKEGMYHEKIGILADSDGHQLVFQGSANETPYAILPDFNFESIAVYPSWRTDIFKLYGTPYIDRFESLWENRSPGVETINIPSEAYENLKRTYQCSYAPRVFEYESVDYSAGDEFDRFPKLPRVIGTSDYDLWAHQRDALARWKSFDYLGIMALATGAGKTVIALHAATKLAEYHKQHGRNFVFVVSVPYQVLAEQWCAEMERYGIQAHKCYGGKRNWQLVLDAAISQMRISDNPVFIGIVVVNATLKRREFRELIDRLDKNELFFVGDECHHHAQQGIIKILPAARYRLGLSATPWRRTDQEAGELLKSYYGSVVAQYSIQDALRDEILTPYTYVPIEITLNNDEAESYQEISDRLAPLLARQANGEPVNHDVILALSLARMRILGSAEQKFNNLADYLSNSSRTTHTLFYCGDGSTEDESGDQSWRDVEKTAGILHAYGWRSSRITAEETPRERAIILQNFRYGYIDAIVAIRVLDEGFDLPECHTAFLLASSRNERQFIQRRGRILRRCEGKSMAKIYDYLTLPPTGHPSVSMQNLVREELVRAFEFARLATNRNEVEPFLRGVANKWNLDVDSIMRDVTAIDRWE